MRVDEKTVWGGISRPLINLAGKDKAVFYFLKSGNQQACDTLTAHISFLIFCDALLSMGAVAFLLSEAYPDAIAKCLT